METIAIDVPGWLRKKALAETEALAQGGPARALTARARTHATNRRVPAVEGNATKRLGPIMKPNGTLEQTAPPPTRWRLSPLFCRLPVLCETLATAGESVEILNCSPPSPPPTAQKIPIKTMAEPVDARRTQQDLSPTLPRLLEYMRMTNSPSGTAILLRPTKTRHRPDDTAVPPRFTWHLAVAPSGKISLSTLLQIRILPLALKAI